MEEEKIDRNGCITIKIENKTLFKHRYIWEKHYGKIPKDMVIHHIDGNKQNNEIENLQMMTDMEHRKKYNQKRITGNNIESKWFLLKSNYITFIYVLYYSI